jgi:predicted exporter
MLSQRPDGWVAFLPVRIANDPEAAKQQVHKALHSGSIDKDSNSEIYFVDMLEASSQMYSRYFNEALLLALVGSLVIFVLLTLVLKSWRSALQIMLPLSIAILWVIAGLVLLGFQLNLLHLVGILLIVAVGSNYALFFSQNSHDAALQNATFPAVLIANLATVLGFGVLAFSQVPALNAVGMTVAPGAILALFLSLIFTPNASESASESKHGSGHGAAQ